MVNDGDKNKSKVQFDETYQKVHDDAMFLIKVNFGAKKEKAEENKGYLGVVGREISAQKHHRYLRYITYR